MPFIKEINPTFIDEEGNGITSVSPAWVVSFLRYENRDSNNSSEETALATRAPFVVENDCVALNVSYAKSSHTSTANLTMRAGDINYLTAVAPGDVCFINILNDPKKARDVADRARNLQNINRVEDGFKGIFRVQSVRLVIQNDTMSGTKQMVYQIQCFAFSELNNVIYFIPQTVNPAELNANDIYFNRFQMQYHELIGGKDTDRNVQKVIKQFSKSLLGGTFEKSNSAVGERSPSDAYFLPKTAGQLMGLKNVSRVTAKDLYRFILGIQQYSSGGKNLSLSQGMNPIVKSTGDGYFESKPCSGVFFPAPEYFNQVSVWSILQRFVNPPVNEMYTAFRVAPDTETIQPTLVFRQLPFSSNAYKAGASTKFLDLPRWKIHPGIVEELNIGRDDAARINYVQIFGRMNPASGVSDSLTQTSISEQISGGKNVQMDREDIKRSGLRPYVQTLPFDWYGGSSDQNPSRAPEWAKLIADYLIGGHLKLNGSISCQGIVDPIPPGDNLEFNGVVYHIETVSHQCQISPNGEKDFMTTIQFSNGVTLSDTYPEMTNNDIKKEKEEDWRDEKILPGTLDEQDVPRREKEDSNIYSKAFNNKRRGRK